MKFGIREIVFMVVLAAIPVGAWWFVFRPSNARNARMLAEIDSVVVAMARTVSGKKK